jgi:hypothetical protein
MLGPVAPEAKPSAGGLAWPDGSSYTGPLRDGKPHGQGKFLRLNGSYYEGGFEHGVPHGQGKLVSDLGLSFEGRFDKGVARGPGRLSVAPGAQVQAYEGEVEYMIPSGTGVLSTTIGRHEGRFLDGLAHGAGTLSPAKAPAKLSGTWRYGLFDFPAAGETLFTGPVNERGERDGKGWCRPAGQPLQVSECRYTKGKPADDTHED